MIALVLILATAHLQVPRTEHPVRWTTAVGPSSRRSLEAGFERPVKKPREQRIFTRSNPSREICTCPDYLRARRDGWSDSANNFERATESFFKDRCDVITLVLAAEPSRVSYVESFTLDGTALDVLPPSLSWAVSNDEVEEAEAAERRGLSWRQYKPGLKVLESSRDALGVDEDGARIDLETKAFGDFDGDGVEDVLLFVSYRAVEEGTMRYYTPVLLTRTTAGGPLRAREVEADEIERAAEKARRVREPRSRRTRRA